MKKTRTHALIFFALLLCYWPAFKNQFIWDDDYYVYANPFLQDLKGLWSIWFTHQTPQYYPLTFTALWLEYRLWAGNPFGYHLVNVLLHFFNTLLAFRLLCRLCPKIAFGAVCIFAFHPMQVETVAWITEQKNLLALLFLLLTCHSHLEFIHTSKRRHYLESLLFFGMALFSKTISVCFIAFPPILKWWKNEKIGWREVRQIIPFLGMGLIASGFTAFLEKSQVGNQWIYPSRTFGEHLVLAGQIFLFYIQNFIYPDNLIFFYPRWDVESAEVVQWTPFILVLSLSSLLYMVRDRLGKGAIAVWILFVISIAPALGFFKVYPMRFSFVADHFLYISSLPLAILFSGLIHLALEQIALFIKQPLREKLQEIGNGIAVCISLMLGTISHDYLHVFYNEESLWTDVIKKNPASWIAYNNLGSIREAEGKIADAHEYYLLAVKADPDRAEPAYFNLGALAEKAGYLEQAMAFYKKALSINPGYDYARLELGNVYLHSGKASEAMDQYRHVATNYRGFPPKNSLAELAYHNWGVAAEKQGQWEFAGDLYRKALNLNPEYAEANFGLANIYSRSGKTDEAITYYRKVAILKPDFRDARYNLGYELFKRGDLEEARLQFSTVLELDPHHSQAKFYLNLLDLSTRR